MKRLGGTAIIIARIITIDGVITITIPVIITIIVITTTVIITITIAGIIIVTGIIGIAVIGGDERTAANFRGSATVVCVTTVAGARFRRPIASAARADLNLPRAGSASMLPADVQRSREARNEAQIRCSGFAADGRRAAIGLR